MLDLALLAEGRDDLLKAQVATLGRSQSLQAKRRPTGRQQRQKAVAIQQIGAHVTISGTGLRGPLFFFQ